MMTVVKAEGRKRKENWVAQVKLMERDKDSTIRVKVAGTGKSEREGVDDRRVVQRAAVDSEG